jgi:hypothetical protein
LHEIILLQFFANRLYLGPSFKAKRISIIFCLYEDIFNRTGLRDTTGASVSDSADIIKTVLIQTVCIFHNLTETFQSMYTILKYVYYEHSNLYTIKSNNKFSLRLNEILISAVFDTADSRSFL